MPDSNLIARYDMAAENWGASISNIGYGAAYRSFIRCFAAPLNGISCVCDIGTGGGTFALAALSGQTKPDHLTLVDPSGAMLKYSMRALANKANTITGRQTSLAGFRVPQKFDLVLGAHVIEHCPNPTEALAQLYDLVAPGGQLLMVISRPHWCQWIIWFRWQHRWFSETKVRAMALNAGLPSPALYRFASGPPQRTSFGYCFERPTRQPPLQCKTG